MNFQPIFHLFLIKMIIKIKKGDFMKMSVSPTRNTHFHSFGECFCKSKSIKTHSKNAKDFENHFLSIFLHFEPHFEGKKHQKTMPKFNEKTDSIFKAKLHSSGLCRSRPADIAMAARDLRIEQNQEFQENPNTACARGAPDLIASRIPPG